MEYINFHTFPVRVIILIALLLGIIPLPFLGNIFIPWFITFIFLWQCDNDYHFNPIFIFIVSILFDFFSGGLLGLNALLFLLFSRLVYNNRFILRGQSFYIKWLAFGLWMLAIYLLNYIIVSLSTLSFAEIMPLLAKFLILTTTYPLMFKLFNLTERYK